MKKLVSFVVGIVIPAFIMAGGVANSAVAQGKAAKASVQPKVLLENAKVRVFEVSYKPGDANTGIATSRTRIVRVLKGATTEYTFADGKKEKHVRKTGEVFMSEAGPAYTNKNIGKTMYQIYVVELK
jgi:hypothetical protein